MTNPILIDLLLLAVVLVFTLLGVKRGFILTLCSLVAVLVALWGARFLADTLSPTVAGAVKAPLEKSITAALEERFDDALKGQGAADAEADLDEVVKTLRDRGGAFSWAADALEKTGDELKGTLNEGLTNAIAQASAAAAAAVAGQLAYGVIFMVSFILILIGWTILSHALNLVAKLPGLSSLNGLLGGVLGLVKGLIIAYVAVWGLSLTGTVSPETAEGTKLFLFLLKNGPLDLLVRSQSLLS